MTIRDTLLALHDQQVRGGVAARLPNNWKPLWDGPVLQVDTPTRGLAFARDLASWRERALNAEDALRAAHNEITMQRTSIAELLGRIRDLEQDLPPDGVQRIITDNTTLKQEVHQLRQENRQLEDRLRGARDNARFLDKRVADLEAAITDGALLGDAHRS